MNVFSMKKIKKNAPTLLATRFKKANQLQQTHANTEIKDGYSTQI